VRSQLLNAALGPKGQESSGTKLMEVDAPDPPAPERVWSVQGLVYYISDVLHNAKTRYLEVVIPRFYETEPKPPYVCLGCSNHTYGQ
jgi:hypothetical protein